MRGHRHKIIDEETKSLGSQIPGLSMFVIMLAFFIVLNSVSVIKEERAKPLMQSVEQAFSSKIYQEDNLMPSTSQADVKGVGEGTVIDRMEAMFSAHITGAETQKDENTGTLLMRLKYEDFTAAVTSIGTKGEANVAFLNTLTSMMRSEKAGQPYRMDVFLQVADNPGEMQSEQPQKTSVLMRDLAVLAQQLEKAGLPQRLLSIGMEQGKEGMIELLFRPHVPYNPLGVQPVIE